MTNRIFGIGLSRTGTKSLASALGVLGHRCAHYPGYRFVDETIEVDPQALRDHDALLDTPIALAFERLDRSHPGSKFIYTVREREAWLDSCRRFFFEGAFKGRPVIELCRQLYGTHVFDEKRFSDAYDRHDARVRTFFEGRERDLLVIEICGGEGWEKLCPFIDRPVPRRGFPRR